MKIIHALPFLIASVDAFSQPSAFIQPTVFSRHVANTSSARHSSERCRLNMATIAVFGASGLTSSECVYQALERGDTVIGLTRDPSKLKIPKGSGGSKEGQPLPDYDGRLTMIAGSVTDKADVAKAFAASETIDGVIIGLGGKTSDVGNTMLTDGTNNIIEAMKEKGMTGRLAVVTSIGAGDSENQAPFFFKILMKTAMKKIFVDKNNQVSKYLCPFPRKTLFHLSIYHLGTRI
mmetsp:Transcript_18043/g.41042  ORF Transcript_18043/g.41042 Transcript_18043/m.41042 type:complete len:234 (-) Transcript_18043:55-756(-)